METNQPTFTAEPLDLLDGKATGVAGQVVLPGMQADMGYESTVLDAWEERFCWRRVLHSDEPAYKSYIAVKPRVKETTAQVESCKLLRLPKIIDRIEAIQLENRQRYRVTADEIMEYYGKVAKIDRRRFLDLKGTGRLISLADLDDELASIVDFETLMVKDEEPRIIPVVPPRAKGYEGSARIMGLDKSKIELTGKDGGPVESITATVGSAERFNALREKLAGFARNDGSAK